MKKHIIWSNKINMEDWKDFIEEMGYDDLDENEQYNAVCEMNNIYLDDARTNLSIPLDGRILVIADLGLWDGRHSGYKVIDSNNIKDILYGDCNYVEWYSDGYNIRGIAHHHDGTNYYEYREIREDRKIDNLLKKLVSGKPVSRKMINYYTKSIAKQVNKVYHR